MYSVGIVRPSWPEIYQNYTIDALYLRKSRIPSADYNHLIFGFLFIVLIFHLKQHVSAGSTLLFGLLCCSIGLLLAPLVGFLLIFFAGYRWLVDLRLRSRHGYISLMDGSDAYWALETDTARPVINILAFVRFAAMRPGAADLKSVIKAVIQSRLLTEPQLLKLKCRRRLSEFGYYYWERNEEMDISQHVRWMDLRTEGLDEETLRNFVSSVSNNSLPYGNTTFWEVLVSKGAMLKNSETVQPVLFRVHHSVGDGVALVSMFLNSLTDRIGSRNLTPIQMIQKTQRESFLVENRNNPLQKLLLNLSHSLSSPLIRSDSFTKFNNDIKKLNKHCIYGMTGVLQKISLVMFAPIVLASQAFMGTDSSLLHGPRLSGEKEIVWGTGSDTLAKVKFIKKRLKCHFTDVILMAVSNSFERHFTSYSSPPPDVTLVIPARLPSVEKQDDNVPSNAFTVAMMKLPIKSKNKLDKICYGTRRLRIEPHYLVNYWLLKVLCTYLPITLIRDQLESKQATVAFSNIPGPALPAYIDGHLISDMVFWPPNRDTTGVGISVLSYGGHLNFGMIIDGALLQRKDDAKTILDGLLSSIDTIYQSHQTDQCIPSS